MLTLKQMRYFDALATTLHFRRAAELAHVSQPALSAQIRELERHLGVQLVERGRGTTVLTRAGTRLLPRIRSILNSASELETEFATGGGALDGLIRIGIIPTVAPYLVPGLIPRLRNEHKGIEIELKETVTANLVDDLKVGRLDAILIALPLDDDSLAMKPLFEDRFLIAGAEDGAVLMSPMAQDEIDVEKLLLLEEGHCLRDQALAVCAAASDRRLVTYGATSMATLLQMVSHGMGLTLVPEIALSAEASRHRMRIARFAEPEPSRTIALVWRRGSKSDADFALLGETIAASARAVIAEGADRLKYPGDAAQDRPTAHRQ